MAPGAQTQPDVFAPRHHTDRSENPDGIWKFLCRCHTGRS